MFANHQVFGDFKENVNLTSLKTNNQSYVKGLKSRSVNSFSDSTNVINSKNIISAINGAGCSLLPEEKEYSKPKIKVPDFKIEVHEEEETWSDIEEMHIHIEPDDDYEDILPQCERIQKEDIDSLFLPYFPTEFTELTVDRLPSPLPECKNLDILEFSPVMPEIKASLFDDTNLAFIALPCDLLTMQ